MLREMQLSISIVFPFSVLHSFGYCFQLGIYIWYTKVADKLQVHDGIFRYEIVNLVSLILVNIFRHMLFINYKHLGKNSMQFRIDRIFIVTKQIHESTIKCDMGSTGQHNGDTF